MRRRTLLFQGAALLSATALPAQEARPVMTPVTALEWRFLADTVMGGVSEGQARLEDGALRLTGMVSTANNGGFIQARADLPEGWPADTQALRLRVRGDGQRYFIHLRTTRTSLPWQYYQAGFQTAAAWADVILPLSEFTAAGQLLRRRLRAEEVRSLGLVAFGRDHMADVSLSAFGPVPG